MGFQEILQEHDRRQGQAVPDGASARRRRRQRYGGLRRVRYRACVRQGEETGAWPSLRGDFQDCRRRQEHISVSAQETSPRRFRNSLRRRGRVQAWRRGKAFGVSLGNSLESDFNWAVIRGPGSGLQKGETPRSEKVPEGEFASESGIERKLAAALRPHGGCLRKIGRTWRQGRNEKRLARRQSSPGGNGAWRISRTASALGSGTGMMFA